MKQMSKSKLNKFIVLVLVFTFIFSPVFTPKANAQWVVFDPSNFANTLVQILKDYGLDSLAWMMANLVIDRMTASTVNWINSGFNGSPAYITDPQAYFTEIGDVVGGQFIIKNPDLNFLCGPIGNRIQIVLSNTYYNSDYDRLRWQCTLTDAYGNIDDFMENFENGGWDKFFRLSQERQNNPIGAYLQAEGDFFELLASKMNEKNTELSWGKGLLSQKECEIYGEESTVEIPNFDGTFDVITVPAPCLSEKTVTPGTVIEGQLNEAIGSGTGRLEVADEINEIVSALLNTLMKQVIGGIGRGLRGASQPDSTNQNQVLTDLLVNTSGTTTEDYFGNQQDTDILNTPIPDPYANQPASSTEIWPTDDLIDQFKPNQTP